MNRLKSLGIILKVYKTKVHKIICGTEKVSQTFYFTPAFFSLYKGHAKGLCTQNYSKETLSILIKAPNELSVTGLETNVNLLMDESCCIRQEKRSSI